MAKSIVCNYKPSLNSEIEHVECPDGDVCKISISRTNLSITSMGCLPPSDCPRDNFCYDKIETHLCCCLSKKCNNEKYVEEHFRRVGCKARESDYVEIFVFVFILVAIFCAFLYWVWYSKRYKRLQFPKKCFLHEKSSKKALIENLCLVKENMSRKIMRGSFGGLKVIFKAASSHVLTQESKIYDLMHDDPLFSSSHIIKVFQVTQIIDPIFRFAFVAEYFEEGSIYDLLMPNKIFLDYPQLIYLIKTFASGLSYLHQPSKRKPAIVHRNIKSSKILIKRLNNDFLSAVISDLSCAVPINTKEYPHFKIPTDILKFTINNARYMSPELLKEGSTLCTCDPFAIDMYAFSIVTWEMLTNAVGVSYSPPFWSGGFSVEHIKQMVLVNKFRPEIRPQWLFDDKFKLVCQIVTNCWDDDPSIRMSADTVHQLLS